MLVFVIEMPTGCNDRGRYFHTYILRNWINSDDSRPGKTEPIFSRVVPVDPATPLSVWKT